MCIRNYVALKFVVDECRVFSTKERNPYCCCLEVFRPEEDKEVEHLQKFDQEQIIQENDYRWIYDMELSNQITLEN